jgi:hypothetical protein
MQPPHQLSRLEPGRAFTIELPFRPLLESWERREHPSQLRLVEYRAALAALAGPTLEALDPPLALGFHAAGRKDIAAGCDLDNFLTPVVKALGGGDAFSLVWATRGDADERAALTLARADDVPDYVVPASSPVRVSLTMSPERREWKETIARVVGVHECASGNAQVELALRFRVSPRRNWVTLWKPVIDALGGVLGEGNRVWHPRDDRISLLILKRELAPELGWEIELDVSWATR